MKKTESHIVRRNYAINIENTPSQEVLSLHAFHLDLYIIYVIYTISFTMKNVNWDVKQLKLVMVYIYVTQKGNHFCIQNQNNFEKKWALKYYSRTMMVRRVCLWLWLFLKNSLHGSWGTAGYLYPCALCLWSIHKYNTKGYVTSFWLIVSNFYTLSQTYLISFYLWKKFIL